MDGRVSWLGSIARLAVAVAVLVVAPAVPGVLSTGSSLAVLVLPVESIVVLLVLVAVPLRMPRRIVAMLYGVVVTAAIVLAAIDAAFRSTIDRGFEPLGDGPRIVDAYGVVEDAVGPLVAVLLVAVVVLAIAGAVVGLAAAALVVGDALRGSDGVGRAQAGRSRAVVVASAMARPARARAGRAVLAGAVAVWVVSSLGGTRPAAGIPLAASDALDTVAATTSRSAAAMREQAEFERAQRSDAFGGVSASRLVEGLSGKDVVIVFVESYGQVAVQGSGFSDGVSRVLAEGDAQLARDGYSARSAFLTSPTFGGVSWLAHATLQSGLWIDSQLKYDDVVATDRLTLASAFRDAGWRTVSDVPSNDAPWAVGTSFYGYDAQLNAENVGYRGPAFSYARIPDQYTLKRFADRELAPGHDPVMAEIDLVSSHTPWTPLPELVPWDELGDGSVFDPQPARGLSPAQAWADPETVQRLYGESIEYSLGATLSFLHEVDDPDLVLVLLGDHQPARIVSGADATHDVPIAIVARDASVFDRITAWGWDAGLHPSPDAPVWRMDAFRDRFFQAFGAG